MSFTVCDIMKNRIYDIMVSHDREIDKILRALPDDTPIETVQQIIKRDMSKAEQAIKSLTLDDL